MKDDNIVDLSKFRGNGLPGEEKVPTFDELTPEEQEQVREMAAKAGVTADPTGPQKVQTAFLVFVTTDGQTVAHHDITLALEVERPASIDDIFGAVSNVQRDISAQSAAAATMMMQQQVMAQMAQQQQAQQIASKLGPNLKNPNPNGPRRR